MVLPALCPILHWVSIYRTQFPRMHVGTVYLSGWYSYLSSVVWEWWYWGVPHFPYQLPLIDLPMIRNLIKNLSSIWSEIPSSVVSTVLRQTSNEKRVRIWALDYSNQVGNLPSAMWAVSMTCGVMRTLARHTVSHEETGLYINCGECLPLFPFFFSNNIRCCLYPKPLSFFWKKCP